MATAAIPIKKEILLQAEREDRAMGQLKGSFTHGKGNKAGFVGEIISCALLGGVRCNTFHHDFLLPITGERVEVKTKRRSFEPMPHYNCSVSSYNPNQQCDYYLFTCVDYKFTTCWVLGYLPRQEFMNLAVFLGEGELDPVDNARGWSELSACYNVRIDQLKDVRELWRRK